MATPTGPCARDLMTAPAKCLAPDMTLREAVEQLADANVSGAPVVTSDGNPVGVLSLVDVVGHLAGLERAVAPGGFYSYGSPGGDEGGPHAWARTIGRGDGDALEESKVSDVMTGDVYGVAPEASWIELADEMWKRRVHRLLVLDRRRVVGIVSSLDMLRALATAGTPAATRAPKPRARRPARAKR